MAQPHEQSDPALTGSEESRVKRLATGIVAPTSHLARAPWSEHLRSDSGVVTGMDQEAMDEEVDDSRIRRPQKTGQAAAVSPATGRIVPPKIPPAATLSTKVARRDLDNMPTARQSRQATTGQKPPPMPAAATGAHPIARKTEKVGRLAATSGPNLRAPSSTAIPRPNGAAPGTTPPGFPAAPQPRGRDGAGNDPTKQEDDDIASLMSDILASEAEGRGDESPDMRISDKSWYAEVFDETYLKMLPDKFYQRTLKETQFIQDSFGFAPGAEYLDVGCGFGRHALELASRGYKVTGVDLSRVLLERALSEATRRKLNVQYLHGDMRDLNFDASFDGIVSMQTSFGYFDDRTNFEVLASFYRALRPGGRVFIETVNRDHIASHVPRRIWWDVDELLLMEEVDFDITTSRLKVSRTVVDETQDPWEQRINIRLYSAHELSGLLTMAGFRVLEISGDMAHRGKYLGTENRQLCVLAEKPRSS